MNETHAADVANIFVRHLLCEISKLLGGFHEDDWEKTLKYFDNKCAYTGQQDIPLVQDHVIAHNRDKCGLHLYGNIIPASKEANSSKSSKTIEEFFNSHVECLRDIDEQTRKASLQKIKEFQEQSHYFEKVNTINSNNFDLETYLKESYQDILNLAEDKISRFKNLTKIDKKQSEIYNSSSVSQNDYSADRNRKMDKNEAKKIVNDKSLKNINLNGEYVIFSNIYKNGKWWWLNPEFENFRFCDIFFILNNSNTRKIIVIKIPKGSIPNPRKEFGKIHEIKANIFIPISETKYKDKDKKDKVGFDFTPMVIEEIPYLNLKDSF
jgi:hypothetical protein